MTRAERPATRTDVSSLLRLGSRTSLAIAGLFIGNNVLFTVMTVDRVASPWPSVIAMVMVNVAAILTVTKHPDPLPNAYAMPIIVAVVGSTLLISWQLPESGAILREAWHLGSNTWLLFFLVLRGRVALAWAGYAAMAATTVAWAVSVGRPALDGVLLIDNHAAILFVASLFVTALRGASLRINDLNMRSLAATSAAAATTTERETRRARVAELSATVGPLLERIASGKRRTGKDRQEYRIAEAQLRDGVRAESLHVPAIVSAAASARARGVDVTLLDDRGRGLLDDRAMARATHFAAEVIEKAADGSVTVRLAPEGRSIAMSIVVEPTLDARQRIDLGERGEIVTPPTNKERARRDSNPQPSDP